MAALKYWLWLSQLPRVNNQMKLALLNHFNGELDSLYHADRAEYMLVEGMTRSAAEALENKDLGGADKILGDCDRLGLQIMTIQDSAYPYRLRNIYNPPIVLYARGRKIPQMDDEVAIAMVGSRRVSAYGMEMGEKLAYRLASQGAVIVSGLAAGGDACAHRGALRAGGFTVAVIGGGHDIVYPKENRLLYEDIAVKGLILSEYPPGTEHRGGHFPVRNRIISGLCLATVVIEAPLASGTLITANHALEQGRDVFAIPGHMDDSHCAGSNRLLRDGAGVITDVWDILNHYVGQYPHKIRDVRYGEARRFGGGEEEKAPPPQEKKQAAPALPVLDLAGEHGLSGDQVQTLRALNGRTVQLDDLIDETQIPTQRVLSALTMLQLEQRVNEESGKRFSLAVILEN